MIIHRDYTSSYNSIIKIFPNHIQFYNPGGLPDTISIEQLLSNNYISKPRNRQIAKMVKGLGWIERYGTGIKRVRRMFVEYGLSEPVFKEETDGMLVTVFGLLFDENTRKFEERDIDKSNEIGGAIGGAIGVQMEESLSDRQIEILKIIMDNPSISYRVLSKNLNINESAVLKHIDKLKKKGIIEREGKTRGYWKIVTSK